MAVDSVSVTKSIRVSPEMAALMDNLIAAGEFSTTSDLIISALAQFLERFELDDNTRVLRLKVPADLEKRLQVLASAGDGPKAEDAAVRVLRDFAKERVRVLSADNDEFDQLAEKLQKRRLDQATERVRQSSATK